MDRLFSIIRYTFQEHWRNRVYLTVILFGAILLGGALVVSSLAVDARLRMLSDLGLAAIEFISLIAVVFVTVNLILQEVESRTIYLLLSHPLPRWQYLLGRYAGTLLAIGVGMLAMAALHAGLLGLFGFTAFKTYAVSLLCAVAKVQVVGAAALFLSLLATSAPTAMTFTLFLWMAGHFSSEMKFLAERSANPLIKVGVSFFYYVAPNFSYFNYRDFADAVAPSYAWFGWLAGYTAAYTVVCLALSHVLFAKREF